MNDNVTFRVGSAGEEQSESVGTAQPLNTYMILATRASWMKDALPLCSLGHVTNFVMTINSSTHKLKLAGLQKHVWTT